jgi:hypothetical protein
MVAGPKPIITQKIIPEDYRDFGVKNIQVYNNRKELQKLINRFVPHIYVQASLPCAYGLKLPRGCKRVYVSHGLIGGHTKGIIKKANFDTSVWKNCDLYCGGGHAFKDWIYHITNSKNVLLNAVPQFDIIKDPKYYNSFRKRILSKSKNPNAKKIILFIGFCCRARSDFKAHNEDYFKTVIELERLAAKNNWLVMVKPRQTYSKMMRFLKAQGWKDKYREKYAQIQNSKYLHFISTTGHIYRYFFADIFVLNGCSTAEIEACVAQKPLVLVRTHKLISKESYDPFMSVNSGAALEVKEIKDLAKCLAGVIDGGNQRLVQQKNLIKSMGLTIDGQMHKRIQNRLAVL